MPLFPCTALRGRRGAFGGGPGGAGMRNPFGGDILKRIAGNPKLAAYLADDTFVAKLKLLQSDPNALSTVLTSALGQPGAGGGAPDPRMLEVVSFLLGINLAVPEPGDMGAGSPFGGAGEHMDMDREGAGGTSAPAPAPAPAPEPEPELDMSEEAVEARRKKAEAAALKAEGTAAYKARDFPKALAKYTAASELDPDDITHRLNIAATQFEAGQLEEAIATCNAAIEHGRGVMAPFALIGKAFARIGNAQAKRGNLREAIEAYESSLAETHRWGPGEERRRPRATMVVSGTARGVDKCCASLCHPHPAGVRPSAARRCTRS
jgi:stress-induced-phosphoprotein 1